MMYHDGLRTMSKGLKRWAKFRYLDWNVENEDMCENLLNVAYIQEDYYMQREYLVSYVRFTIGVLRRLRDSP
jgi:hypothetical protein